MASVNGSDINVAHHCLAIGQICRTRSAVNFERLICIVEHLGGGDGERSARDAGKDGVPVVCGRRSGGSGAL